MLTRLYNSIKNIDRKDYRPVFGGLEILKYIGPGLLVTVGFIDPGNWASNLAAGSAYGYKLLWMVTLSTIMLVILQHNVAHLGIATGLCLSEAATKFTGTFVSRSLLTSAMAASVATSMAEILGGAIALQMLVGIPVKAGSIILMITICILLFTNSYRRLEKWIIGFVSVIGLSFIYELSLTNINWMEAATGWVKPSIPKGSMIVVMSVLGAVVMPHNLFLHSEIIQSRQWNLQDETVIRKQLRFEFLDTLFSMIIGWAINSAMILLAASAFFGNHIRVSELQQAQGLLQPLLGNHAALIFAVALLFSGIASAITSAMAGGSIFAGFYGEPFDIKDNHSRLGALLSLVIAVLVIFLTGDPFKGLVISQMLLSIQLPFTVFFQVHLTSSQKVMGKYANSAFYTAMLLLIGSVITYLNVMLFIDLIS
ncbi:MAG TPA: Nramp family divalent metal transporter [Bacteroidales bacterium]|nr:Nramp family divalent metal transporter [Bacteroidales bacterium]HPT02395.1 Nramp family divalent metal transporter [Bacteroidales bacterium]